MKITENLTFWLTRTLLSGLPSQKMESNAENMYYGVAIEGVRF